MPANGRESESGRVRWTDERLDDAFQSVRETIRVFGPVATQVAVLAATVEVMDERQDETLAMVKEIRQEQRAVSTQKQIDLREDRRLNAASRVTWKVALLATATAIGVALIGAAVAVLAHA